MERVAELSGHLLTGLALDSQDDVFAISACSGELFRLDKTNDILSPIMSTETSPHAIAIDPCSGEVYITDRAENAILRLVPTDTAVADEKGVGEKSSVGYVVMRHVQNVDGHSLIAPTSLTFSPDGELFFTDAGAEGDSSFADPIGAIYRTVQDRTHVVPLCSRGLIRPSGIAVAPDDSVYVCEQGQNRVLRFVLRGTYYVGSVFAQLHGFMGPSAIAVNPRDGSVFVAQFDSKTSSVTDCDANAERHMGEKGEKRSEGGGRILVLGEDGEVCGIVRTPHTCISAIALDARGETLYAVEADATTGRSVLYRFSILQHVVQHV